MISPVLEHTFKTSFTPEGEPEESKLCPGCLKMLPPKKFKSKTVMRVGVKGTARNSKCRTCEDILTTEKKSQAITKLELSFEALRKENNELREEFTEAIMTLRSDLDKSLNEIKKLRKQISESERLKSPKRKSGLLAAAKKTRESRSYDYDSDSD